jgi:ribulose-5-phosphate 4-epimerase/fuculose-1-phosphate aldolase
MTSGANNAGVVRTYRNPADASVDQASLPETVATACRILAEFGLVEHILGHVSVRIADDAMLIRCRGPRERGLAFTSVDDVRPVGFDGRTDDSGWSPPNELPIHAEVMRARPEVTAVVHAHPAAVVAMSLADVAWQPIVGAYDIPASRLAADGIPVWPRACLVNTGALGRELAGCLGPRPVAVLRGHGVVSVASGAPATAVARAVVQAVSVDSLARMTLAVLAAGGTPEPISDADMASLPDLGDGFNVDAMWRFLSAQTARRTAARADP